MLWPWSNFDPYHTETYKKHFGSPKVEPLPSPLKLFWGDVGTVLRKLYLIPDLLKPFYTNNPNDELYLRFPYGSALIWLVLGSLIQAPLALLVIFAAVIAIAAIQLFTNIYSFLFWDLIQGPPLQVYPNNLPAHYNPRYRWIFINGIMVDMVTLRQELTVISETFNAPVLGIHNRTYGFLGDLAECILQRAFGWQTLDTRTAEPIIKKYLKDVANVDRVIIVTHSQGGIITSDILNAMYSEVPWDLIHGRLEVYTFASAAREFRNPWLNDKHDHRLVSHMEHYCNQLDLVCQFGALASVKDTDKMYMGRMFIAEDWPGHLLNQDYLSHMFPGPDSAFLNQIAIRDPNPEKRHMFWVYWKNKAGKPVTVKELSRLAQYMTRIEIP